MTNRPIYLDHHATTPLDERVLAAMIPYLTEKFGNPASNGHIYGWETQAAVQKARQILATAIHCTPEEIVFTSGATEANNLAIKGVAEAYCRQGQHLITLQTEHRAILDPCRYLEDLGFEVTYLPVQPDGLVNLAVLEQAIRPDTILVSVMAANNEIGVLQPLAAIGAICRRHDVLFHSDAAQAIAKIPLDVEVMNIDLLSLTAHKIFGPKGTGALYVRRNHPRVCLAPQMHGGGHERGLRSGTLYTPQIVGFAEAIRLGLAEQPENHRQVQQLRDFLWQRLQFLDDIYLNGHPTERLAGNLNISIGGVEGSALLLGMQSLVALSSGSACSSHHVEPSHVLKAIGRSDALAYASLRFGIAHTNTLEEIDRVATQLIQTVKSLRQSLLLVNP